MEKFKLMATFMELSPYELEKKLFTKCETFVLVEVSTNVRKAITNKIKLN